MGNGWGNEKEVALRCAVMASRLCQEVQKALVTPEAITKGDRSPVTVADYGSQAVVCRILREAFPWDPIVAEEDSKELRKPENARILQSVVDRVRWAYPDATDGEVLDWIDAGRKEIAGRYWCLDPIDGTKGFLRGDQYAVALALIIEGEVHVGVLACPNLPHDLGCPEGFGSTGTIFFAAKGQGAFQRGLKGDGKERPIHVRASNVGEVRFCESYEPDHADHHRHLRIAEALGITAPPIRMDSQAKYGIVARGEASIYLRLPSPKTPEYREKVWDHAAGALLIQEAGGKVTDTNGRPLDFGVGYRLLNNQGIIATDGLLHEAVLSALQTTESSEKEFPPCAHGRG